jgi:5-methylthioadenosine/S-adenosylhomocysteine deaminase
MKDESFLEDGAVAIKDGKVSYVGKSTLASGIKAKIRIDAEGKVALPGLVNCHTHVPMTLFRGIAEDQPLGTWLKRTIWPLEAKLKPEDVYAGALLGCLEMIKSGTTCFADMYFHEDMVARATEKSGLRSVLAQGIFEAGNRKRGEKLLNESIRFAKDFHGYANDRIRVMLGPHAAYSCSPELLIKIMENASELGVGVHIHLAESDAMFRELKRNLGSGEVEFLEKLGFLEGHVLAAHCINLSRKDMRILSNHDVNVVHVPVANTKLGLGVARIRDLVDLGVNVSLGTDGPASNNSLDMFETMKIAALLQKLVYQNPTIMPAFQVLEMATINGAKALGLEDSIGSIEVGKKADIILIDLSKPHLKPLHNIYASIVYSARSSDVDTVIVDGKTLMENGQIKALDEQAIIEKAEKTSSDLLSR